MFNKRVPAAENAFRNQVDKMTCSVDVGRPFSLTTMKLAMYSITQKRPAW